MCAVERIHILATFNLEWEAKGKWKRYAWDHIDPCLRSSSGVRGDSKALLWATWTVVSSHHRKVEASCTHKSKTSSIEIDP